MLWVHSNDKKYFYYFDSLSSFYVVTYSLFVFNPLFDALLQQMLEDHGPNIIQLTQQPLWAYCETRRDIGVRIRK